MVRPYILADDFLCTNATTITNILIWASWQDDASPDPNTRFVLGIWSENPILPRAGYDRLKAALISGGFARGTPYETAVDNSLAEQVVAEDPPALR